MASGFFSSMHCLFENYRDEHYTFCCKMCRELIFTHLEFNIYIQDRDESRESLLKGLPVVSLSVGDSAEFLYGNQRNVDKAEKVLLESGDVLIFGGKSRHIFHSVASIIPKSAPRALYEETSLRPGRVNLTFRQF